MLSVTIITCFLQYVNRFSDISFKSLLLLNQPLAFSKIILTETNDYDIMSSVHIVPVEHHLRWRLLPVYTEGSENFLFLPSISLEGGGNHVCNVGRTVNVIILDYRSRRVFQ